MASALVATGARALAQDAARPRPDKLDHADWRALPRAEKSYYPEKARVSGVSGAVVLDCVVQKSGRLRDCNVIEETPEGFGFGAAALDMASLFRMVPIEREGTIRFPIKFQPPK